MIRYSLSLFVLVLFALIAQQFIPVLTGLYNSRLLLVTLVFLSASVTVGPPVMLALAFICGFLWDAQSALGPAGGDPEVYKVQAESLRFGYSIILYGVIGYDVTQRMHELGIRIALGAQRSAILGLVLGRAIRITVSGVAVGLVLALLASRWLQPLLFQQSARDGRVYAAVGVTMLVVAIIAGAMPARRAAGADPNAVLRAD